ncbi:MAG: hypothetical protein NTY01_04095 [Verrucomicrobia bacterium]|nr:hypothetical protein [Verrucomicrobiota bacterium]
MKNAIAQCLCIALTGMTALGEEIKSGETVHGKITAAGEQQIWTFSANAGDVVSIGIVRTSADFFFTPQARLYDRSGEMIGCSRILYDVDIKRSGMHSIICAQPPNYGKNTGTYNLSIIIIPASPMPAQPSTLKPPQTVHGEIAFPAAQQVWTFSANAGNVVSIGIVRTSADFFFRPRAQLYDPNGKVIGCSRIPFDVVIKNAGMHSIICAQPPNSGTNTGTYNLSIAIILGSATPAQQK